MKEETRLVGIAATLFLLVACKNGGGGAGGGGEGAPPPQALASGTTFQDVTVLVGNVDGGPRPTCSCTVLMEDFDGDGDLDLFAGNHMFPDALYQNFGKPQGSILPVFAEVANAVGLADPLGPHPAEGGVLADLDDDGWRDLYMITGTQDPDDPPNPNAKTDLLLRGGPGAFGLPFFLPFSQQAGVTVNMIPCGVGILPDWVNPSRPLVWRQHHEDQTVYQDANGSGPMSYLDVSAALGVAGVGNGDAMGIAIGDYDNDGDMDVYVGSGPETAGDTGENLLFQNLQGAFSEVATAAGANLAPSTFATAFGDYDNDGDLDLYLAMNGLYGADPTNVLLRNQLSETGSAVFTDVTSASGTGDARISNCAAFADFDNDGWLDLYVANSEPGAAGAPSNRDALFMNQGDGTFVDAAGASGIGDNLRNYALTLGDVDGDGFVDAYLGGMAGDPNILYRNGGNTNHWLEVDLRGQGVSGKTNRDGVGARIRAVAGGLSMIREIAPTSPGNHTGLRVHFGLGTATTVDLLEVRWPSGQVQSLINIAADQILAVSEP